MKDWIQYYKMFLKINKQSNNLSVLRPLLNYYFAFNMFLVFTFQKTILLTITKIFLFLYVFVRVYTIHTTCKA